MCLYSCTLDMVWCAIVLMALTNKRESRKLKAQGVTDEGRITLNYLSRSPSRGVEITIDECKVTSGPTRDEIEGQEDEEDDDADDEAKPNRDSLAVPGAREKAVDPQTTTARPMSLVKIMSNSKKEKKAAMSEPDPDDPASWRADHHNQLAPTTTGGSGTSYNEYSDLYGF